MITVENLTKRYGSVTAVNQISFEVAKGEIVGFLGPNGAGKSTTMRMLSCYLPPTSGRAEVAGYDIFADSLRAREHIGYLPESAPLYTDMRVGEYLAYRASLKRIPRPPAQGTRGRHARPLLAPRSRKENHRHAFQGLSPARRPCRRDDPRARPPHSRRADDRARSQPDSPGARADPQPEPASHDPAFLAHPLGVEALCGRVIIIKGGTIEALDTPENLRSARPPAA